MSTTAWALGVTWAALLGAPAVLPAAAGAGQKQPEARISFDTTDGLTCKAGFKCVKATAEVVEHDAAEGPCSVKTTWQAAPDSYGLVTLQASIPETDFAEKSFAVRIKPLNANGTIWGVALHDATGTLAEDHRMFQLGAGKWHNLIFTQGSKIKNGYYRAGKGDIRRITQVVFRAQTRGPGQVGEALWDDFRVLSPVVTEETKRAPDPGQTPPTLSAGETAVWLDASRGYALAGIRLAGRRR
jgi:hypothetical protein